MGWHVIKDMNLVGKVMCKVLSNRMLPMYKGMIGFCLKDTESVHFECAMHNVYDTM